MSHQSNQIKLIWKDVESKIRCSVPTRYTKKMSNRQISIWQDSLVLLYFCWYDSLRLLSGVVPQRLFSDWLNTIIREDVADVTTFFKVCDDLLLLSTDSQENTLHDYDSFKRYLKKDFPFAGALLGPAKGVLADWLENESIQAFNTLHQLFAFINHLSLPGLDDLKDQAVCRYRDCETRLSFVEPTEEEQAIITRWLPRDARFQLFENFAPHHSSGAVADCTRSTAMKYQHIGMDDKLRYLLNKCPSVELPRDFSLFSRTSKLICVPKSTTKLRTICSEPATLQWAQQGFKDGIVDYIHSHPYLKRRIDLRHSELNSDLAWEGSIGGSFATIDLSDASDSVSFRHVCAWFDKSALREILHCTRSSHVCLPDATILELNKFAPMGSSLNFPVECLVFCAIVEAAIMSVGGVPRYSRYRVYGDDIVVEQEYAKAVMERLQKNGFIPNYSKSFFTSNSPYFRESCGGEFLDGRDVTPIRIPRRFEGYRFNVNHPSQIQDCVDLCNSTYVKLPSIRRILICQLQKLPINLRVPFNSTGEGGLFSPNPTNWHLNKSYYEDLQVTMFRHGVPIQKHHDQPDDEDIRLYEYLRCRPDKDLDPFGFSEICHVSVSPPGESRWASKESILGEVSYV